MRSSRNPLSLAGGMTRRCLSKGILPSGACRAPPTNPAPADALAALQCNSTPRGLSEGSPRESRRPSSGANHRPRSSPALPFPRPLLRRENLPEWLAELRETFACVLSIYYERLRGGHMGGRGMRCTGRGVRGGHTSRPAPPRGHQPGSAPHGTGKGSCRVQSPAAQPSPSRRSGLGTEGSCSSITRGLSGDQPHPDAT